MISLVMFPPVNSQIIMAQCIKAYSVVFGSIPRSKRKDASVLSPCRFAVFLTLTGLKYALSKNMLVVVSVTPLSIPPKTPAMHMGFSASHIIKSSLSSSLSKPSRVVNLVPVGRVLILI